MAGNQTTLLLPTPVRTAIERLNERGFEAYAVGGCVRDSLLGKEPKDWDVTVSSTPDETKEVFSDCRIIETGVKHGTVTVLLCGEPLELTTYRLDGDYLDNRHPSSVSFTRSLEDDLARRDFTVNAMAYHPARGIVDLYGGRDDLAKKLIRAVGDPNKRFDEDGLRILRALRFASVLGFSIEEATDRAIHEKKDLLCNISPERIREEFCKLLLGVSAKEILLDYSDVLSVFLPEIAPAVGFDQKSVYHCYDVYRHMVEAVAVSKPDLVTRLVLYFHDIGKPSTFYEDERGGHFRDHAPRGAEIVEKILLRLRFPNDTVERVTNLVYRHDTPIPPTEKSVKRLMQKFSDEDIDRLMEIKRCDRLAHAEGHREPVESLTAIPELVKKIREDAACFNLSGLAVKGGDLIAIGIPEGPEVGILLNDLLEKVIDGELPNDKSALLTYLQTKR
ncbi:MAG: HD domain-containing protein [Clostridia bacterium]|nr:HD domain-containing protein [Clostridia bacterium]